MALTGSDHGVIRYFNANGEVIDTRPVPADADYVVIDPPPVPADATHSQYVRFLGDHGGSGELRFNACGFDLPYSDDTGLVWDPS